MFKCGNKSRFSLISYPHKLFRAKHYENFIDNRTANEKELKLQKYPAKIQWNIPLKLIQIT